MKILHSKPNGRRKRLGELLIDAGLIDETILKDALEIQKVQDKKLGRILMDMQAVDDLSIARAISDQLDVPLLRLAKLAPSDDVIALIKPEIAEKNQMVPVKVDRGHLVVAMANPLEYDAVNDLRFTTRLPIITAVSPLGDVLDAISRLYPKDDLVTSVGDALASAGSVEHVQQAKIEEKTENELANLAGLPPVVRLTNALLADSIRMRASDIHIEPQKAEDGRPALVVRCRIDGVMRETLRTDRHVHTSLVSRIKVLSGMDISVKMRPQDGRTRVKFGDNFYDLRVSTIPTTYGEKVTIRVLDPGSIRMSLEDLGFAENELLRLEDALQRPQGIMLITGPTGSGKSTTLYACLNRLNTPMVNVITVEDPVEFDVAGINQVQINSKAGIGFSEGLRSILRQDPDIIMVGEIRDAETAAIAMQAAQTGHLLLSTLHTNDAPSAIPRLLDLGVEGFQIASSLIAVLGQRLARRIHTDCRIPDPLDDKTVLRIAGLFPGGGIPDFQKGSGCAGCHETGYQGRIGLYEVLTVTPTLMELIRPDVPAFRLREAAEAQGFRTMDKDGMEKALSGITTIEEVLRVAPPQISCSPPSSPVARTKAPVRKPGKPPASRPAGEEPPAFATELRTGSAGDAPLVLVVEDNEIIRLTIADTLESRGFRVMEAEDGEDALAKLASASPALIVTDYMMPKIDGIELISRLKELPEKRRIPIIMLTAVDDVESEVAVLKAGADDYLTKPVDRGRFLARVDLVLQKAG